MFEPCPINTRPDESIRILSAVPEPVLVWNVKAELVTEPSVLAFINAKSSVELLLHLICPHT